MNLRKSMLRAASSVALAMVALGPVRAATPADNDVMQMFQLDLLPYPNIAKDPNGAVLARIPGLKPLVTRMNYGPSLGDLVVFSTPENAPKIKELVKTYMNRPRLEFILTIKDSTGSIQAFAECQEGDEGMMGAEHVTEANNIKRYEGFTALARGTDKNGVIQADLKIGRYIAGRSNSFTGTVPLKVGEPKEITLSGPDHVTLIIEAHEVRT